MIWPKGRPHSDVTKQKMSATHKALPPFSDEQRQNMSNAKKGLAKTEDHVRKIAEAHVKHGLTRKGKKHQHFTRWANIMARCYDPENKSYKNYGARGVTVCDRWHDPGAFCADIDGLGSRPVGYSLDRIDNNGNYEPGNVRWASAKEQRQNQRPGPRLRWTCPPDCTCGKHRRVKNGI